ncbi:MAG: TonB-dependent receptor [Pseudomonadota bacterium]|nr:TonB-dependent receptor [Pseudomonadota bacterium]
MKLYSLIPLVLIAPCAMATDALLDDIEHITITSQRIDRTPLGVSSNITVFDEETIRSLNISNLDELLNFVPNFSMQAITGDYAYIQVRGLPRNYEQSTLSVFIDGVPYSSLYGLNLPMNNIASVEVIKGPQGNLFGRNTRDGIIVINSKKPTDDISGMAKVGFAELGQTSVKGDVSGALISDKLWLNLGGNWTKRDGTVNNTQLNSEVDPINEYATYAKLYFEADNLSARLSLNYDEKDNGLAPYVVAQPPLDNGDDLEIGLNIENEFKQTNIGYALSLDWQINHWTLSSITSHLEIDTKAVFDADYSDQPYGSYHSSIHEKDLYQEFKATYQSPNSDIDWLLGASYNRNRQNNANDYPLFAMTTRAKLERTNHLAYVDLNWQLNDVLQVQVGTRYFNEDVSADTHYANMSHPVPSVETSAKTQQSDDRFLSKAAINYQFIDNQRLYFSYGQGYLSAGTSWLMEYTDDIGIRHGMGLDYKPELSNNFELGYKADFDELATSLELSIFNTELKDYQHFHATVFGFSRVTNIDTVKSQGAELNLTSRILDSVTWQMSAGYNNAHVESLNTRHSNLDISKTDKIPMTPRYSVANSLMFSNQISSDIQLDASISWQHSGDLYFDFKETQKQSASNVFNANLSLNFQEAWTASLWVNNLTDQRVQQFRIVMPGSTLANYITPRQVGVTFARSF